MKKITKTVLCSMALIAASGATVFADMKKIPDPGSVTLKYGRAQTMDTPNGFGTQGKCDDVKDARVAVYVKDTYNKVMAAATVKPNATGSCTWNAPTGTPHEHHAGSDLYK